MRASFHNVPQVQKQSLTSKTHSKTSVLAAETLGYEKEDCCIKGPWIGKWWMAV